MNFRTEIKNISSQHKISHKENLLLVGSCFAESIGEKLSYFKFPILVNPCGILFNPVSIRNAFQFISEKKIFTENDLVFHDGLWHSFFHHGSFSNADKTVCLDTINNSIFDAHDWLMKTKTIIITLGTSYVWEHKSGLIVSNCHKIPSTDFTQYKLSVEQVEQSLQAIIENIKKINQQATIIFTVSPIRYLNHGAHQSQLSKATLLLAIDNIEKSQIEYFPSYEIMMDDLRDYRFYAEDMIHPSNQAVEYIWEKFSDCFFDNETNVLNKKIDAYQKAMSHRILNPTNESGQKFTKHIADLRNNLHNTYPFLDV
jgi:hypothetical protein